MRTLADVTRQQHCDTVELAVLARQIALQIMRTVPAASITDLTPYVDVLGGSTIPYLQRSAGDALISAINEYGQKLPLIHALRTLPQQYALWTWYLEGRCGNLVTAMPGSSAFENGVAIEIDEPDKWIGVLRKHGWESYSPKASAQFVYLGPQDPRFVNTSIWAFQRVWNTHHPEDELKPDGVVTPQLLAKLEQSPATGFLSNADLNVPKV